MIRFRRIDRQRLNAWLVPQTVGAIHPHYQLRLWREDPSAFPLVEDELRLYLEEVLDDARRRLRRGFEDDLSPFDEDPCDPAANYPARLHRVTLQGYLGETLGAMAIEHWGGHGRTDWCVPAFLFRFHIAEFQHLERINQQLRDGGSHEPDAASERRPGRTGDDSLAFVKNNEGVITHVLALEAKCLTHHNSGTLAKAHAKLATGPRLPESVRDLIELLADYDTPQAQEWHEALLRFRSNGYRSAERYDGVAYLCCNRPKSPLRVAWMPVDQPHESYNINRQLEGLEFQLTDMNRLVDRLYRV